MNRTPNPNWTCIVTGLPRSGTSMMMRMLEAGGLSLLTDHARRPDEDNPRGYFEFEPVKWTRHNQLWLDQAVGKAVKVLYHFVPDLPMDRRYKLVMMSRNLDEVVDSQVRMLSRRVPVPIRPPREEMKWLFLRDLARVWRWTDRQACIDKIHINYNALMECPRAAVERLSGFLALRLAQDSMIDVVDPSLYRNRFLR